MGLKPDEAILSWILSSGSRDGKIINHDVRVRESIAAKLNKHTHEVYGLNWSTDFKNLASSGNLINISPSTVRALAWCPWQSNILAIGGGTADRCIKFWNV